MAFLKEEYELFISFGIRPEFLLFLGRKKGGKPSPNI